MVRATPKTAVIGAGMAGLTCARELAQRGVNVVVFDKGRGLGGRMATRRAEGGFQFDHGAPYVSAQSDGFASMLTQAEAAGAVAHWSQACEEQGYVGVPGMTGLAKYLGLGLTLRKEVRIDRIVKADGGWKLVWADGAEVFDRVVVTVPAPQIAPLLPDDHIFIRHLNAVRMDPCLTLMVGLRKEAQLPLVFGRNPDEDISWVNCDNSKPGRPNATSVVAQAGREWSIRHLELERDKIAELMLPLLISVIGADLMADPAYVSGHRWRYALVSRPLGQSCLVDKEQTLFAGGDWCLGANAEHAWTSGQAIAEMVLNGM